MGGYFASTPSGAAIYEAVLHNGPKIRQIYIKDTDSHAERGEKARRLYRKVVRFVKAMIIASSEVSIPPYVMHGWSKPSGMASDVWWEHSGWMQALHADNMVRDVEQSARKDTSWLAENCR
eukprot:2161479-Amphidinium_carterae.2